MPRICIHSTLSIEPSRSCFLIGQLNNKFHFRTITEPSVRKSHASFTKLLRCKIGRPCRVMTETNKLRIIIQKSSRKDIGNFPSILPRLFNCFLKFLVFIQSHPNASTQCIAGNSFVFPDIRKTNIDDMRSSCHFQERSELPPGFTLLRQCLGFSSLKIKLRSSLLNNKFRVSIRQTPRDGRTMRGREGSSGEG